MARHLLLLGFILFTIGLLTGLVIPKTANPRMALSSHLEAVMNGLLLVVLGLVWPHLDLGHGWLVAVFWLAVYSTFANWTATLLAAIWNAGAQMPIAAPGRRGSGPQEAVINALLATLTIGMLAACVIVVIGLT